MTTLEDRILTEIAQTFFPPASVAGKSLIIGVTARAALAMTADAYGALTLALQEDMTGPSLQIEGGHPAGAAGTSFAERMSELPSGHFSLVLVLARSCTWDSLRPILDFVGDRLDARGSLAAVFDPPIDDAPWMHAPTVFSPVLGAPSFSYLFTGGAAVVGVASGQGPNTSTVSGTVRGYRSERSRIVLPEAVPQGAGSEGLVAKPVLRFHCAIWGDVPSSHRAAVVVSGENVEPLVVAVTSLEDDGPPSRSQSELIAGALELENHLLLEELQRLRSEIESLSDHRQRAPRVAPFVGAVRLRQLVPLRSLRASGARIARALRSAVSRSDG